VHVDLGGGDGGVAQELLHLVDPPPRLHQRRGVGVAQLVGGEPGPVLEPRPPGHPLEHGLHRAGREGLPPVPPRGVAPQVEKIQRLLQRRKTLLSELERLVKRLYAAA